MIRRTLAAMIIVSAFVLAGCDKDKADTESVLYGVWTKGINFGDTLYFLRKNNQDIMRKAESFNAGVPVYSEKEYRFRDGKLSVKMFAPTLQDYYPIDSFNWTREGREFKLQGIQLYMFMSSTLTYFTYRKI